jgi:hypothetical protein
MGIIKAFAKLDFLKEITQGEGFRGLFYFCLDSNNEMQWLEDEEEEDSTASSLCFSNFYPNSQIFYLNCEDLYGRFEPLKNTLALLSYYPDILKEFEIQLTLCSDNLPPADVLHSNISFISGIYSNLTLIFLERTREKRSQTLEIL